MPDFMSLSINVINFKNVSSLGQEKRKMKMKKKEKKALRKFENIELSRVMWLTISKYILIKMCKSLLEPLFNIHIKINLSHGIKK